LRVALVVLQRELVDTGDAHKEQQDRYGAEREVSR
jgi:hypothetical protein